jgi:hypothetical protein
MNSDDAIKYLTSEKNLPLTLEILRQAGDIRRHVFCDFWQSLLLKLRDSVPKVLAAQSLQWTLLPDPKNMDHRNAGVFLSQSGLKQAQFLTYFVNQYHSPAWGHQLYFGIAWEKPRKPAMLKTPAVSKLANYLSENKFKETQWDLGWQSITQKNQSADEFLAKHAKSSNEIHRQIQESFWPLVEKTFGMVMKANKAVRHGP